MPRCEFLAGFRVLKVLKVLKGFRVLKPGASFLRVLGYVREGGRGRVRPGAYVLLRSGRAWKGGGGGPGEQGRGEEGGREGRGGGRRGAGGQGRGEEGEGKGREELEKGE